MPTVHKTTNTSASEATKKLDRGWWRSGLSQYPSGGKWMGKFVGVPK